MPVPMTARLSGWRSLRHLGAYRGFTLIEMLVVVSLIAILTATALPRIRTMTTRQQVDRATQIVASDIRLAFSSAARGRVPVRVTIPTNSTLYAVVNRSTGDTIVRRDLGSGDLRVQDVSGSMVTVEIFPNGVGTGADTVTVRSGGYSRRIAVSRVGYVRVMP